MTQPLTSAELQKIIERWMIPEAGITEAVRAFAQALPVTERTVWFWIGGRKIHPAFVERIRSLKPPKTRKTNPKKER